MITIRGCVLAGVIGVALIKPLNAQEDKAVADKIASIAQQLAGLHNLLSVQKSLSLVAFESGHVEPGFGHDDSPDFTATFKLFYKGNRFLYDVEFLGPKGPIVSQVESFDGEHYEYLKGGLMSISSKPFVYDIIMSKGHVFFMPFTFLQSGFRKDALAQLSYDQLTKKDDWKSALTGISAPSAVGEVDLENQTYLKITKIGMDLDPVSDQECRFDVYFAGNFNWYPMKWERRLWRGDMTTSYSVEELGFIKTERGENIPYPKISVLKHYRDGKLRDTERLEMRQISFGSVSDDDLSINPASANVTYDVDTGVKTKVSK